MRADPDAGRGDLAEQRVELRAVEPLFDRVHPDEHAVAARAVARRTASTASSE